MTAVGAPFFGLNNDYDAFVNCSYTCAGISLNNYSNFTFSVFECPVLEAENTCVPTCEKLYPDEC